MNEESITVSKFPPGNQVLLWLGGIERDSCELRGSSMAVFLAPLDSDGDRIKWQKAKELNLPVGLLPQLEAGMIWKDGKMVNALAPKCKEAILLSVDVGHQPAQFLRLVSGDEGHEFCLNNPGEPAVHIMGGHYPLPPKAQGMWGIICDDVSFNNRQNRTKVIIPCMELLRFYFCTSASLTRKVAAFGLLNPETSLYSP